MNAFLVITRKYYTLYLYLYNLYILYLGLMVFGCKQEKKQMLHRGGGSPNGEHEGWWCPCVGYAVPQQVPLRS